MTLASVASNLLTMAVAPCVPDMNKLVVNVTHPSVQWSYTNLAVYGCTNGLNCSGATIPNGWAFTQPMQPFAPLQETVSQPVATWQAGDTINVYEPLHIVASHFGGTGPGAVIAYHTKITAPIGAIGFSAYNLKIDGNAALAESRLSCPATVNAASLTGYNSTMLESARHSAIDYGQIVSVSGSPLVPSVIWSAGAISRESRFQGLVTNSAIFDFAHASAFGYFTGIIGSAYLDAGAFIVQQYANFSSTEDSSGGVLWGLGTHVVSGGAVTTLSHSAATSIFAVGGSTIDGLTSGVCASVDASELVVPITNANLDLCHGLLSEKSTTASRIVAP